jgi:ribosomal protein S1
MSEEKFDFGALLDAQFKGMDRNSVRYAKADREAPTAAETEGDDEADEGPVLDASLKQAYEQNLPIDGKVEKEVKGGYEVTVRGQRAFCPYSLIDRVRKQLAAGEENPYVGQSFTFRISEYGHDDRGVNLIVSRRAQQEAELETAKDYLRGTLEEGQTINGTVVQVLDFGCFVELGGLQGLVPVREISWDKVDDPRKFVKVGDLVTAKVLSVDWSRDRISLSIRQCQAKPLKPRTPEEIARDAEAEDVKEWMDSHGDTSAFSNIGGAFDGIKL